MDSPGSSCLCTLVMATTSWLSSTPPTPTAQSTSSHSLPSSQPVSTMLDSTVVMVFMFSISFSLGVCFTIGCWYIQACCKPKQGTRNKKTKPTDVPQPPIKRARPMDTQNTNQPTPKRARPMDNTTPTARYHGHAKQAVVTIPWPIPSKLP